MPYCRIAVIQNVFQTLILTNMKKIAFTLALLLVTLSGMNAEAGNGYDNGKSKHYKVRLNPIKQKNVNKKKSVKPIMVAYSCCAWGIGSYSSPDGSCFRTASTYECGNITGPFDNQQQACSEFQTITNWHANDKAQAMCSAY